MQDEHKAQLAAHAQAVLALVQSAHVLQGWEANLHAHMRETQDKIEQARDALHATYQAIHPQVQGTGTAQERELDELQGVLVSAINSLHTALGAPLAFVGLKHGPFDTLAAQVQQVIDRTSAPAPAETAAQS